MNPVEAFMKKVDLVEQMLNRSQARILALENALYECAEYFEKRADTDHHDEELRLLLTIDEALED